MTLEGSHPHLQHTPCTPAQLMCNLPSVSRTGLAICGHMVGLCHHAHGGMSPPLLLFAPHFPTPLHSPHLSLTQQLCLPLIHIPPMLTHQQSTPGHTHNLPLHPGRFIHRWSRKLYWGAVHTLTIFPTGMLVGCQGSRAHLDCPHTPIPALLFPSWNQLSRHLQLHHLRKKPGQ